VSQFGQTRLRRPPSVVDAEALSGARPSKEAALPAEGRKNTKVTRRPSAAPLVSSLLRHRK
jgi:hypothetical protein